jgi:flagellar biosynthesis protein FliP
MRMDALARHVRWIVFGIALLFWPRRDRPSRRKCRAKPRWRSPAIFAITCPQSSPVPPLPPLSPIAGAAQQVSDLTKRENLPAALQIIILLTVLSLAPSLLIMMTSFTRIIIVLSLLRQAMGTQQLPPNQVLIGLSLFMTFLIMAPTWDRVNNEALKPYMNGSFDQKPPWTARRCPCGIS